MKFEKLQDEIDFEINALNITVEEIVSLYNELLQREPNSREKAELSSFLIQFYNGIENILKRIRYFHTIRLPKSEDWYIELFNRFCNPTYQSLPLLFDGEMITNLVSFRKFRHLAIHGYSFQIE